MRDNQEYELVILGCYMNDALVVGNMVNEEVDPDPPTWNR